MTLKLLGAGIVVSAVSFLHSAIAAPSEVNTSNELISKWLLLEQQESAIKHDWLQQKPLLAQRLTLLEKEESILSKQLKTNQKDTSEVEQKREQLIQSQTSMESEQAQLQSALNGYFRLIAEFHPQLPPPLYATWQTQLNGPDFSTADETTKLTVLIELLEQLDNFEQRISHLKSPLLLDINGEKKEVVVHQIYLGISQAWYASLDGQYSGSGQPSATGWQWQASPNLDADTIIGAVAMLERSQEAEFISLPLTLTKGNHSE